MGLELQPLFLLRWSNAQERGPAFKDLFIDSVGLRGGVGIRLPESSQQMPKAFAELGIGLGIPLMARAQGPWLRSHVMLKSGQKIQTLLSIQLEWQFFLGGG